MRVLIACEESQTITMAFRELGHEAYSCDIQDCSGGHPEWHIKGDALKEAYSGKYDLMIAHPPCTYLSNAGSCWLFRNKVINKERYEKGLQGKAFFLAMLNAPVKHIAVENPIPVRVFSLPEKSQIIHPYYFGDAESKATCLWLKNLPLLKHEKSDNLFNLATHVKPNVYISKNGNQTTFTEKFGGSKIRSKTFTGIAQAMAKQWGIL